VERTARRPAAALALIAVFALFAVLTVVGFLLPWRREVASEEGKGIDETITYLLVVTGILVLLGHAVLIRFLWRSSAGGELAYGRPSKRAEWLWSLIPVLAMLGLSEAGVLLVSGPVWDSLYAEQPRDPLLVEVVGKQFEWYVHYPGADGKFGEVRLDKVDETDNLLGFDVDRLGRVKDAAAKDDVVKRGQLHLPVGRPVVLRLRTYDVIHSFFVPEFRVKQDLLPGHPTRLKFTPTRKGTYELACAELCGLGHYTMKGQVHVVSPEEFEGWLRKQPKFGG
jgi:cytochrome c oxidase subunit 2